MSLYIYIIILFASFILYVWPFVRKQVHMLQLNSYRNERYKKWLNKQVRHDANYLIIGLILISFTLGDKIPLTIYFLLHAIIFLVLRLLIKRQKEKKPLVYTWRVKRLLFTLCLLSISIIALFSLILKATFLLDMPFFLGVINLFFPSLIMLTNKINGYWEKHIALGFLTEAKEKLASLPGLKVIGITGSFGKTSTKYVLNQLLSVKYQVLMTPESYNTPMGVVRTIRERLNGTHEIFICEMGAKNIGDIKEICDIVKPELGIISSIGEQHLETFLTIDNVIKTKFELAKAIEENNGTIFLNYSNDYIRKQQQNGKKIRYGIASPNESTVNLFDLWAENLKGGPKGSSFELCQPNGNKVKFTTNLLGQHNVLNIVAACAIAISLGMSLEQLVPAVRRLEAVPHRLQLLKGNGRYHIIDDAFNANPQGAQIAVETLGTFAGFRVLITPGLVELGLEEDIYNHKFGQQAAPFCDFIILVGENRAKPIKEGALKAGFSEDKIYVAKDIFDAFNMADALAENLKDVPMYVLLENDLPDNFLDV